MEIRQNKTKGEELEDAQTSDLTEQSAVKQSEAQETKPSGGNDSGREAEETSGAEAHVQQPETFDTAAKRAVDALRLRGWKAASAESLTGGLIAARLTSVPGASAVFGAGFVTYSNKAKHRMLGVRKDVFARYGAVSAKCAKAMAKGGRKAAQADVCVAVTGNAGPDVMEDKPVGLVYIACSSKKKTVVEEHHFKGDRADVRMQTADRALALLASFAEA